VKQLFHVQARPYLATPQAQRFLDICDREGRVAIICPNGPGRAAALVAAWLVQRARFHPHEALAWLHLVLPADTLGPEHRFLIPCRSSATGPGAGQAPSADSATDGSPAQPDPHLMPGGARPGGSTPPAQNAQAGEAMAAAMAEAGRVWCGEEEVKTARIGSRRMAPLSPASGVATHHRRSHGASACRV
jgi:hypothetical protein